MSLSPLPSAPPPADNLVMDVDLKNFMPEVIEASKTKLVIVDFWSARSPACKEFLPVLEKLARAYKGGVRIVKCDIDRSPEIAQQMGIQSVPAVFAFFQGRPADGFMGALPEAQVKSWIDRLIAATGAAAPVDEDAYDSASALKQAAAFLAANDFAMASAVYADILDAEPNNAEAYAGMLRCLTQQNKMDEAKAMLAKASPEMQKHAAIAAMRTAIELADEARQNIGASAELEAKVKANPADHQARFDLASACFATGQKEQAIDHLLEIVRRDRKWKDEAARKQLVKFFEALGAMDPLTIAARKRLSSLLFA